MVTNALATTSAVMVRRGTVMVSFEKRSVTNNKNRFPCAILGRGPRISIETYSNGSEDGNNFKNEFRFRYLIRFFAHVVHSRTISEMSLDMFFQNISVGVIETFSLPQGVLQYGENAPSGEVGAVIRLEP